MVIFELISQCWEKKKKENIREMLKKEKTPLTESVVLKFQMNF